MKNLNVFLVVFLLLAPVAYGSTFLNSKFTQDRMKLFSEPESPEDPDGAAPQPEDGKCETYEDDCERDNDDDGYSDTDEPGDSVP